MSARSELWERIRVARNAAGLNQSEIAEKAGVTRVAVGHWESADPERRTKPPLNSLKIISEMTGAPLAWLLSDESELIPTWDAELHGAYMAAYDYVYVPTLEANPWPLVKYLHDNPDATAEQGCKIMGLDAPDRAPVALHGLKNDRQRAAARRMYCVRHSDASMAPEIMDGDYVVVSLDLEPQHNDLVLFATPDTASGYGVRRIKLSFSRDGDSRTLSVFASPAREGFPAMQFCTMPLRENILASIWGCMLKEEEEGEVVDRYLGKVVLVGRTYE